MRNVLARRDQVTEVVVGAYPQPVVGALAPLTPESDITKPHWFRPHLELGANGTGEIKSPWTRDALFVGIGAAALFALKKMM